MCRLRAMDSTGQCNAMQCKQGTHKRHFYLGTTENSQRFLILSATNHEFGIDSATFPSRARAGKFHFNGAHVDSHLLPRNFSRKRQNQFSWNVDR